MVDVPTEAPTWSGTPRLNTNQYIQDAIDAGSPGTTYVLKNGQHRGQRIDPQNGDIIEFESTAIMMGSEDISGGWTTVGDGTWWKAVNRSVLDPQSNPSYVNAGYLPYQNDWVIVDGMPHAYRASNDLTSNPTCAFHDTSPSPDRLYINTDPTGVSVEIARERRAIVGNSSNVIVRGQNRQSAIIENYASSMQGPRAAVQGGRAGLDSYSTTQPDTNWLYEDMIIRNCAGSGLGLAAGATFSRGWIYQCGQIGVANRYDDDTIFEYSMVGPGNCISGIRAGWEGGNSKFAHQDDGIVRGCYFVLQDYDNMDSTSILWWDINNTGISEACLLEDLTTNGASPNGGLFWEISDDGIIRYNRIIGSSRDAPNSGWGKAIMASDSNRGSALPLQIYGNHVYMCAGGIGGVENNRSPGGVRHLDVWGNITHLDTSASFLENTGLTKWGSNPMDDNDYWDNVYYVPSASDLRWIDDSTDNDIGLVNFADWQSSGGHDTNGIVIVNGSHPLTDPNPSNGGMALG